MYLEGPENPFDLFFLGLPKVVATMGTSVSGSEDRISFCYPVSLGVSKLRSAGPLAHDLTPGTQYLRLRDFLRKLRGHKWERL